LGGFIKLGLGNSLLILWFRMMVVLPLMALLAIVLYPNVWRDIKKFLLDPDRRGLMTVVGSGFFLFLSQVLIYIAIPQIGPGVAVTILFMYPIITVPLAWLFFGDRPTFLRVGVMCAISLGVILAAWPKIFPAVNSGVASISGVGVGTAAASGIAFAFYLIFMQLGFQKLHPVPVSLVQFTTIFVLASVSLMLPLPENLAVQVIPDKRLGLIISGVVLGVLTLAGYLLNNFGVRFLGAARASIIASSGPVLTAVLAFLIIPSAQNALQPISILGIVLVTLGVFALSFERLLVQNKAQPAK
jgi:drug/metabolite transporter (DMT)-like permease